jgi:acyl-coenzyme A thioesterase PaaI-like protein
VLNREPGWNFPGNFLELSFDEVALDASRLSLQPGAHCLDPDGQVSLAALCVLADVGMSVSMRRRFGEAGRMATVSMSLLFTGAPRIGRLQLQGRLEGLIENTAARQGIGHAEVHADGRLICTASSTFVALGDRPGLAPLPMRRREDDIALGLPEPTQLSAEEHAVYVLAEQALTQAAPSFLDRFWGLVPEPTQDGAVCDFANGLPVGNRVGHTQGGITFALAAVTSNVALGAGWQLTGASASYLSPGTGPTLRAETHVLHRGRLTAVAHTSVRDASGKLVLDMVTNHASVLGER